MNISQYSMLHLKRLQMKTILTRCYCEGAPKKYCRSLDVNPQNLPLLPIPKLENTITKLLKSSEPFVIPCDLIISQKLCQSFLKYSGPQLQQRLVEKARDSVNWLDEYYRKYAYLCNRDSLPMSTSSVLTFPHQKFVSECYQIDYVAKLILGVLKFRYLVKNNRLPLDTWGKYPLDMSSYNRLFGNIRQPHASCDELIHHHNSKHIIVMVKNNMFSLKVFTEDGEPLSYNQLMIRLEEIMELGRIRAEPFGLLTSHKRNKWAEINKHMRSLPDNECYLSSIESSLFVVCIDESSNQETCSDDARVLHACLHGFHGHGPNVNGSNRWYDKTLQFFVTRDGCSGIIFEPSPVDAVPLGKMADFVVKYLSGNEWTNVPFVHMCEKPRQFNFVTSDIIQCGISETRQLMNDKISNFSCHLCKYDKYGKEFCKINKVSMDAVIQIALQFAHKMTHGKFCPQAEKATTRKFLMGRNDLIRSCTHEMIRFIKGYDDPLFFVADKYDALMDAVNKHRRLTEDVMEGKGIDCHLFGLLMMSKEMGLYAPKVFQSRAFLRSSSFRIVSRQMAMNRNCTSGYPLGFGCGGYSVCYNPRANDINICVTCRRDDREADARKFLENWTCSMKNISNILCGIKKWKNKIC